MAFCVYTLAADARDRLATVLRGLMIAQLVISLCMLVFCYNAGLRQITLLKDIHRTTAIVLYGLIILQAYAMKLHYTSGLRLMMWLVKFPHWQRSEELSWCWLVAGALIALNGILVTTVCYANTKMLMTDLTSSLRIGMSQYLTEPSWKHLLDNMQVELRCCGIERPSDWHEIPWLNVDFLNEESDLIMNLAGADGRVLHPVTPYSCCTPRVLPACYHDPLQQAVQKEGREAWAEGAEGSALAAASLHAAGCVDALRAPVTRALLGLNYFNLLSFILQIFIVILCQILRTSARDAVLAGDSGGRGRGYLVGTLDKLRLPLNGDAVTERGLSGTTDSTSLMGAVGTVGTMRARTRRRRRIVKP